MYHIFCYLFLLNKTILIKIYKFPTIINYMRKGVIESIIKIQKKAPAYKFVECCGHKFFFHLTECFGMLFLLLVNTGTF